MRVLFISGELIGSAVIHQLLKEGHDVKLYVEHPDRKNCLAGFVEQVSNWEKELDWVGKDGLIVFDDVNFADLPDRLRQAGYSVFGGNAASNKMELDRQHFQQLLADSGVKTLPSYDFATPDAAADFVKNNPDYWVLKQNTHISALNYVGQRSNGTDILDMLQYYKKENITSVHLQKRVVGVEIGVARYFNGEHWVGPIEINLEHKRFMNGDIGPLTAEMGTLMWYEDDEQQPLFQATLAKLTDHLIKIDYKGDIDIGCIVNAEGVWPLEATTRFGTPAAELQCELQISPWGEVLKAIADGKPYDLKYSTDYGIVVSIALPPFPFAPDLASGARVTTSTGVSLFFSEDFSPEDFSHIHFEEIAKAKLPDGKEHYYHAGHHGYALYVTGKGSSVQAARTSAYARVNKISIPNMMYRTDIGLKFINEEQEKLRQWGWIR